MKKQKSIYWSVIPTLVLGILVLTACSVVPGAREQLDSDTEKTVPSPMAENGIDVPTPTLTAATEKEQTIYDLFPVFVGSKWEYTTTRLTEGPLENGKATTISSTGHYSETVISDIPGLPDGVRMVVVHSEGENYQTECAQFDSTSGESDRWYVMDENRFYITCSCESADAIAEDLVHEKDTDQELPDYIAPLDVGVRWARFDQADIQRSDNDYVWYVESTGSVTVPAGTYEGCYRILLQTHPDTTIQQVCPGVGLASWQYTHHGSVNDYSAELSAYTRP